MIYDQQSFACMCARACACARRLRWWSDSLCDRCCLLCTLARCVLFKPESNPRWYDVMVSMAYFCLQFIEMNSWFNTRKYWCTDEERQRADMILDKTFKVNNIVAQWKSSRVVLYRLSVVRSPSGNVRRAEGGTMTRTWSFFPAVALLALRLCAGELGLRLCS